MKKADYKETGTYASLAIDILKYFPPEIFREDEDMNNLSARSHHLKALSCIHTDDPQALYHLKCAISLTINRSGGNGHPDREARAGSMAVAYHLSAMAYMRDKDQEEKAIASWLQYDETFGELTYLPLNSVVLQEWPAIHLAIVYALRGECTKAKYLLPPNISANDPLGPYAANSMA